MKGISRLALAVSILISCHGAAIEPAFVSLAEGFTSSDERSGIVAAQRMFSVPTFGDICAPLDAPARLVVVAPESLELVRNQWFNYDRLIVLAVDRAGLILPPTPIAVEVEEMSPPVLELRSDLTADPDGRVLPIREGHFHIRFRAICEGHATVEVVRAKVVERR